MKVSFFNSYLFFLLCFVLFSCKEQAPDLQAIPTFYPSKQRLQKGMVNKYYYHSKANKSYDTGTDIRYISYQLDKENLLINNTYNPGFELTTARILQLDNFTLSLKEERNYFRGKLLETEVIEPTFLSISEASNINEKRETYDWGTVHFKNQQKQARDTVILNRPAKIFEGNRFINSFYEEEPHLDTLKYKYVYAKDIGLWSTNFEDKNGKYWMELVEQMPLEKFKQLADHGRHRIAYIDPEKTLDNNREFKICNDDIVDYYNNDIGVQPILVGGKSTMHKILAERLDVNKLFAESGYLTFRFVINCDGVAGRFTTEQTDLDFQPKAFNSETVTHFYEIMKEIKGWRKTIIRKESRDAYAYVTFKLKDGEIIELLP